ncbi:hypothetical protein AQUCO_02100079v1 [Aquilegia coerulea]|uniref:BAG domain-containing protein n=1 Tax=Aquilegia coerulea TaxID=218851 RepID=A0A2G5DEU5_AQUCA|nr:hypothetical protein AQUCO_02100079v1 [Aquilegia coerulea]
MEDMTKESTSKSIIYSKKANSSLSIHKFFRSKKKKKMHDLFGRRFYNPSSSYNHHHPSYTTTTTRYRDIPVERNFSSPKVFSIPVHYVGKEINRSTAALRIQKVFRGFLVRKRVKAILGIKKQVDDIEKKFYEKDLVDLLKKDGKERLKLNEMLMGLLFKLDSIRGIDSGVRELRKSVIKKAIMLQESLDSIVFEQEEKQEETLNQDVEEQNWEFVESDDDEAVEETNLGEELGQGDSNLDGEVEMQETLDREVVEEGNLDEYCGKKDATMEIECKQEEKTDDGMKELMEKLMEKNEMLVGMVADLSEKNKLQAQVNQMQARVLSSLIKRVDNLERSFKNERSKCKKQRKQVAGSQDAYKKP